MKTKNIDILIVGVGGQGVLLASEILSDVALAEGYDVKKSEIHGMSQRGGVVSSHVRFGKKVASPTIPRGGADIMLSFEQAESLRAVDWMKPDGIAIVANTTLIPAIVTSSKNLHYPEAPIDELKKLLKTVVPAEADKIALELGNPRLVNTILLGMVSDFLPFKKKTWLDTIKARVKEKFVEINLAAFERGLALAEAYKANGEVAWQN